MRLKRSGQLLGSSRVRSVCPLVKTQTTPALSGSSETRELQSVLTLQKQLQLIMRPSRRYATEPES